MDWNGTSAAAAAATEDSASIFGSYTLPGELLVRPRTMTEEDLNHLNRVPFL